MLTLRFDDTHTHNIGDEPKHGSQQSRVEVNVYGAETSIALLCHDLLVVELQEVVGVLARSQFNNAGVLHRHNEAANLELQLLIMLVVHRF